MLTRLVHEAAEHQAPRRDGRFRPKMRYAHQGGMNPPLVVIHGNSLDHVTDSYKRFLEGAAARALQARRHAGAHRDALGGAIRSTSKES